MQNQPSRRTVLLAGAVLAFTAAACGSASAPTRTSSATSSPTVAPTPTPITVNVSSPADAAGLVIATNPLFATAVELKPDLIGASKWWKAEPLASGGYRIEVTVGWGDCPSGCIQRHVWTYDVDPTGGVKLVSEGGDPVPSVLPA